MYKINRHKLLTWVLLLTVALTIIAPLSVTQAAGVGDVLGALTAPTAPTSDGGGILNTLFSFLFDRILGPILNIFGGDSKSTGAPPVALPPTPSGGGPVLDSGVLRGKVIVVDPGHGGTNPGAVGNGTRESDNNLAVGLKLRDKLRQAGAKVVMTRETDRNVATPSSTLGQELQARVDIAERNNADLFVSVHSNSNPEPSIAGAMTFYPSGKSSKLALEVQSAIIRETAAVDKGTETATFYVLRNTSMPSILVEMGFVTNAAEASKLRDDGYRNRIAQGIFTGIARYFQAN
ncbi:N-acetylmuramoyl-L-alanine amidase family protein [Anaeroselena agilis]|uniref:N-acetylmuramoyl-L-alanine amidase n=1 Tax=Anaeroselena agilis TaxID=3063788 RepID=A0ABU3NX00_9FIRM|nr:N-acetylmuramoyl-L-alanine amidase [Selenomonadales bacterium 4137-cl]